ncbi:hypothetical protein, partial [Brevundimonas sp.]|uniref:hypothetical protein n=1 Tax=Brevundimonas sp. TaxID=1871086 RepID=UPI00391A8FC6
RVLRSVQGAANAVAPDGTALATAEAAEEAAADGEGEAGEAGEAAEAADGAAAAAEPTPRSLAPSSEAQSQTDSADRDWERWRSAAGELKVRRRRMAWAARLLTAPCVRRSQAQVSEAQYFARKRRLARQQLEQGVRRAARAEPRAPSLTRRPPGSRTHGGAAAGDF